MNRPVCHSCAGLPRSFFCNVCDTTSAEKQDIIDSLNREFDAVWNAGVELNTKLKRVQLELIKTRLERDKSKPYVLVGKVLSETEMGIGFDRRYGTIMWFGPQPKACLIYSRED